MIYGTGYEGFKNYKDLHSSRNLPSDIDKPSYPNRLRKVIPKLVDDLEKKTLGLLNKYPWLNSSGTKVIINDFCVTYTSIDQKHVSFSVLELGRYSIKTKVWSWSWVDNQNQFVRDAGTIVIRDYGVDQEYEFLTKAHWHATYQDTIEVSAMCVALKSGLGIEIYETGDFQHYYILLEQI